MLYKDSCNRKSNQQNLGTIKCSNLCTEIVEYSSPDEIAVCNLASIAVNQFVKVDGSKPIYDFARLKEVTKVMNQYWMYLTLSMNLVKTILCKLKQYFSISGSHQKSEQNHWCQFLSSRRGEKIKHATSSHWYWCSRASRCLYSHALSIWKVKIH